MTDLLLLNLIRNNGVIGGMVYLEVCGMVGEREEERERERAEMVLTFILIIDRVILLSWRCGQSVLMSGMCMQKLHL